MGKVYIGQNRLRLVVDLQTDLTGATVKLKYRNPNKETGDVNLNIIDDVNGIGVFVVDSADTFAISGSWTFWAHVTYPDGKLAPGEPFVVEFLEEGQ